jgi:hypothetical protein
MVKNSIEPAGVKARKLREGQPGNRGAYPGSLIFITLAGGGGYLGALPEGVLVIIILGVVFFEFIKHMDQGLPLMQITALLAVIQWLVGPWLTYNVDLDYIGYFMRVDSTTYFTYALPGTAAFVLGLLALGVSPRQRMFLQKVDNSRFVEVGIVLTAIGFAAGLGAKLVPGSLAFLFYLISQLRYVGALYFFFSKHPLRWVYAIIAVFPLFTASAETGMFHDLLLWMGILFCYWYALKKRTILITFFLLFLGFTFVLAIQGIKSPYRDKVWNNQQGSLSKEIVEFLSKPNEMLSRETRSNAVIRINQGWIISAIMLNVPSREPYARGDTIGDAFYASLVPRFVAKDKSLAGGHLNFRRFTGLPLSDTTSMGLSLLGEAYANLGPQVGILLMLLLGGLLSFSYGWCLLWSIRHPTFYLWIPVIFCQTIKAETDLVTVFNHIAKGMLVVFGLYWLVCVKSLAFDKTAANLK